MPRPFAPPSFFTTSSSSSSPSSSIFLLITTRRKFPQTAKVPRKIRLYRANELLSNLKQNFQLKSRRLHFYYLLLVENDPFPNNHPRKPFPRCENKRRNNGVVVRVISPVLHFARKTNIKIYASFFFFF